MKTCKQIMQYIAKQPWKKKYRTNAISFHKQDKKNLNRILLGHFKEINIALTFVWIFTPEE